MQRALIVNQWVPHYRLPFFEQLRTRLGEEGVTLDIACGRPDPELALRADAAELVGAVPLRQRSLSVGRRHVSYWGTPPLTGVDLVVLEQGIRHLALYRALASRPRGCALALWGHGRTYTKPTSRIEAWLKEQTTLRADWFFAYTEGGRRHVRSFGFPDERVTVVQNSQPTLVDASFTPPPAPARLPPTGLFVGGIDESKRIDLLLDAAQEIRRLVPDFRLVVAGRGAQEGLVRAAAVAHDWITYVGFADAATKAELARRSTVLLMPGRAGLIVVDAMVFGLPLITTTYRYHAPELEYLLDSETVLVTDEDAHAYACGVAELISDVPRLRSLSDRLRTMAASYTLETMVENFAAGVHRAIAAGRRR
jgi:glycosyltransferase involved in cell wall biosynthesis